MRPFTLCLFSVAILLNYISACASNSTLGESSASQGNPIGAAYFMTNEPSGNYIISSAIGVDGKLFSPQHTATGGLGARGRTPEPFDPIFSQGVITSSPNGMLAAANPGTDTVSIFSIDVFNPSSLRQLGPPVWTQGEFPNSVTFNKAGDVLCVLNTGSVNGISCFNVDKTKGLSPISNATRSLHLNLTTPPPGPILGTASQVIFSEDDKQLIVAVKGINMTSQSGFLAVWDVYEDYSLSRDFDRVALPSGGNFPFSLTVVRGQNAYLATDPVMGFDILSNVSENSNSSGQHNVGFYAKRIPNQITTCWSAYSSLTENYYLVDLHGYRVAEVSIGENLESTVVNHHPTGPGPLDSATVSIEGRGFLYVLSTIMKAVEVYALAGPGKADHVQRYHYTAYADSVGIKIDATNVAGMATFIRP